MGIPGLTKVVEPYAAQYPCEKLKRYGAVIDGPALAYHAHRVAVETKTTRLPSYADINSVAIRWLKSLGSIGINVSAILFDGALPNTKKAERLSRVDQNVKRVTQFRSSFGTVTSCLIPTQLGSVIFGFLAPELIEALQSSEFASVTRIVPGEADDWCAWNAKDEPRSIIFTADSDLLIYEYPPEVLVVLFKDVDLLPSSEFKAFCPANISQRLKQDNLTPLAYAVSLDKWRVFAQNSTDLRHVDLQSTEYLVFSKRYTDPIQTPSYLIGHSKLETAFGTLDVRVSEFAHQALSCPDDPLCSSLAYDIYLPLLFEDTNQAAAWEMGADLRLLAYSLTATKTLKPIREYMRKAQSVALKEYTVYDADMTARACTRVCAALGQWKTTNAINLQQKWALFAFQFLIPGLKAPHISLLARVINGDFDNTWVFVHLLARVQAVLYSLRILKQCIAVRLALHEQNKDQSFRSLLLQLRSALETLPSIADTFIVPGQSVRIPDNEAELLQTIKDLYVSKGIADAELFEQPKSKRQRKREKRDKKDQQKSEQRKEVENGNNAFAALEGSEDILE